MIGKLLSMSPKPLPDKGEGFQPSITFSGLAPRANSILERMELCSPIELEINRLKSNTNIMDKVDDDDNTSTAFPQSSLPPVGSYQGIYAQFPHHLTTIKHTLPAPTRKIYTMVLLLYAKESGPIHVAQQAEDVVWSMVLRANQQPRPLPEKDNDDEFKLENLNPSMEHWNCVLQCWSMSKDPDRGFHAYSFLRSWVQWNNLCENNTNSLEIHSPTIESYQSVLRACLWNTTSNGKVEELRAREIGSGVAIRLWKDVEGLSSSSSSSSSSSLWSSSSYALLLRAICQTSELPSTSSTRPAVTSFARVFRRCCKDGMMTHEILQLARDATTDSQFSQLVGKDVKLVDDEGHFVSVEEIANRVPFEWMKNSAL